MTRAEWDTVAALTTRESPIAPASLRIVPNGALATDPPIPTELAEDAVTVWVARRDLHVGTRLGPNAVECRSFPKRRVTPYLLVNEPFPDEYTVEVPVAKDSILDRAHVRIRPEIEPQHPQDATVMLQILAGDEASGDLLAPGVWCDLAVREKDRPRSTELAVERAVLLKVALAAEPSQPRRYTFLIPGDQPAARARLTAAPGREFRILPRLAESYDFHAQLKSWGPSDKLLVGRDGTEEEGADPEGNRGIRSAQGNRALTVVVLDEPAVKNLRAGDPVTLYSIEPSLTKPGELGPTRRLLADVTIGAYGSKEFTRWVGDRPTRSLTLQVPLSVMDILEEHFDFKEGRQEFDGALFRVVPRP
jgi:hypothetical protein